MSVIDFPAASGRVMTAGGERSAAGALDRARATADDGAAPGCSGSDGRDFACAFAVGLERGVLGEVLRFAVPELRARFAERPARVFARLGFGRDPLAFARFGLSGTAVLVHGTLRNADAHGVRAHRSTRDVPFSKRNNDTVPAEACQ
jgi:hypothetical protein